MTLLDNWIVSVPGNATKLEENTRKMAMRSAATSADKKRQAEKNEKLSVMSNMLDKRECPLDVAVISSVLDGLCAAVQLRLKLASEDVVMGASPDHIGTVQECDDAAECVAQEETKRTKGSLRGLSKRTITHEHRAAGAFLLLHPKIYGEGAWVYRVTRVAFALGVSHLTCTNWYSLTQKRSENFMRVWVPIVVGMTWKDVSSMFASDWVAQFDIPDGATVKEYLRPYQKHIAKTQTTILSKWDPNTSSSGRRAAAKRDRSVVNVLRRTKRISRSDSGVARKHAHQEQFVIAIVKSRWDDGNPIGRSELYDELFATDGCAEGTPFYVSYIDPMKLSAKSGLSNWITRVLQRYGWAMRKNSIGQTVPPNWRALAEKNAADLRKLMLEVDVLVNADQTFVNFYPEEKIVVAPVGTKRVGGKVKADAKAGFTAMVTVNLGTSQMEAPFCVYNGTKLKDSKKPKQTLAFKYRNWRDPAMGRTGYLAFQAKHWFDEDIMIEYLDWLLDVIHPGKKVGLSMDMAPQHRGGLVQQYIKRRHAEGRLVVGYIDGGLTSVLQVCDLAANKEFKALIKKGYLGFRTQFIRKERERTPDDPNRRINMKIQVDTMTDIVEKAVKTFNSHQRTKRSIAKTFRNAGQDPWNPCEEDFKAHLDELAKLPLYRIMEDGIESRTGVKLPAGEDGEEIELGSKDEDKIDQNEVTAE